MAVDSGTNGGGNVNTSAAQTFTITVTAVNDVPSFTKGADLLTELDNSGPRTVNGWATAISPGPANESGQAVNFIVSNDNNGAFSVQPAISSTGVLTFTPAVQTTAGNKSAVVSVQIHDNGGTANGGVDTSAVQTCTITITHVNIAPSLTTSTITYNAVGNTQLHVGSGSLAGVANTADPVTAFTKSNPVDTDGPAAVTVMADSGTSTNGGSYSVATDGSFTYVPAAGFVGTDTFPFSVTDSQDSTSGTVSIPVANRVWYIRDVVDANNGAGGDGRSTNAFDSIAAYNAATTNSGDYIFVFRGNTGTTPLSGGFTLKNGQKLLGEGVGLNIASTPTPLTIAAGLKPRINNASGNAVSISAVGVSSNNRQNVEVRGLDLSGSVNAVDVTSDTSNIVGVTITDNTVSGAGVEGFDLSDGSAGAFPATFNNNTITATGNGIDARVLGGATALTLDISNQTVTSSASGIVVDGSAAAGTTTITGFSNNAISGNTAGSGVLITSAKFDATAGGAFNTVNAGTTVIGASGNGVGAQGMVLTNVTGDLNFTDLDIFADGGAGLSATSTAAFNAAAGAGLRVQVGGGVSTLTAVGGPALSLTNVTATLPLQTLQSTNSSTTGVNLDTVLGSVSAGGSISGSTGTGFRVNGSNATISYTGPITTTTGKGVDLTTNTGSTISFTGTLSLSSGSNTAFNATGGGTVTSSDTTSTLTSTTGTALNVANTTIGAANLNFRSINAGTAASGPTNGIVLNVTGTTGSLIVSGTGSAASGGTIQKTAAEGVLITGPANASFSWMAVKDPGTHGISTNKVNNFTLANSSITDAAGAAATDDGLHSTDTSGTMTLTNNTINGARHQGITIDNNNTNMTALSMTGTMVTNTPNGDGMLMQMRGTSQLPTATISGSTFSNNFSTGLQVSNADTGNIANLTVQNNTVTNNNAGMDFDLSQGASMTVNVLTNTFNIHKSSSLNVFTASSATSGTKTAKLQGNIIGTVGTLDSGGGAGIRVITQNAKAGTYTIDSNTIREVPNGYGIDVEAIGHTSGAAVKVKLTGNTVVRPTGTNINIGCGSLAPCPLSSVFVSSDTDSAAETVCTVISGNSAYDPTSWPQGAGFSAYYLARRGPTPQVLNLEGNTGMTPRNNVLGSNTVTNSTTAAGNFTDESANVTVVAAGTCGAFP